MVDVTVTVKPGRHALPHLVTANPVRRLMMQMENRRGSLFAHDGAIEALTDNIEPS